jgi:hypothetical protein
MAETNLRIRKNGKYMYMYMCRIGDKICFEKQTHVLNWKQNLLWKTNTAFILKAQILFKTLTKYMF